MDTRQWHWLGQQFGIDILRNRGITRKNCWAGIENWRKVNGSDREKQEGIFGKDGQMEAREIQSNLLFKCLVELEVEENQNLYWLTKLLS